MRKTKISVRERDHYELVVGIPGVGRKFFETTVPLDKGQLLDLIKSVERCLRKRSR